MAGSPHVSGTEDVYKIYAESFLSREHLRRIREEAQTIVNASARGRTQSVVAQMPPEALKLARSYSSKFPIRSILIHRDSTAPESSDRTHSVLLTTVVARDPNLLDRVQNSQLVIHHDIVPGRITSLDMLKLLLLVHVDQNVAVESSYKPDR